MVRSDMVPRRGEAGFTLVEVLVAVTVSAVMLGSVGTALRLMGNSSDRGRHVAERIDMLSRGLAALRQDVARMERVVEIDGGVPRFVFEGGPERMRFVVVEPAWPSDPGSYLVTWSIRQHDATAELVRTREVYDPGGVTVGRRAPDEGSEVIVLEGPYRFTLAYLGSGARSDWTARWSDPGVMPALVRLELVPSDPRVPTLPPVVMRPRIDAEAGCIDRREGICSLRTGRLAIADPEDTHASTPGRVRK